MTINYLIIINIIGLVICYIDKRRAKKHKYRISENSLVLISIMGGCIGLFLGMLLFHHKTKKIKFIIIIPLFIIIWVVLLYNFYN